MLLSLWRATRLDCSFSAHVKFQDALDHKLVVVANERLHGHDAFYEFVEKFEAIEEEFKQRYAEEELKEFLRRDASNPAQNLSHAGNYLRGR